MRILAIETATEACSAAVLDGSQCYERFEVRPRAHLRLLLPMVTSVLEEAGLELGDLDAIAFGCGPGGFTGLRIAAGVAQGLALGADLPVVPVSNLAVLAAAAFADTPAETVLVCQDARMDEVYWATFRRGADGLPSSLTPERLALPAAVEAPDSGWRGVGSGWQIYPELRARFADVAEIEAVARLPRAAQVALLATRIVREGGAVPAEQAAPVYLRDGVT